MRKAVGGEAWAPDVAVRRPTYNRQLNLISTALAAPPTDVPSAPASLLAPRVGSAILGHDVGEGSVRSLELDMVGALMEPLHSEITVYHGHDDVSMSLLHCPGHFQNVVVEDSGFGHGVSAGAQEVRCLGVRHQQLREVDALGIAVFCR
jgi:hypothetical protein